MIGNTDNNFHLVTLCKQSFRFWNDHIKHAVDALICTTKKSENHEDFSES